WILSACEGYRTLARCHFSQGNLAAVQNTLTEAIQTAEQYQLPNELAIIRTTEARLATLAGDTALATRWMQTARVSLEDDLAYESEQAHLVLARVNLALGRPHHALVLLKRLRRAAQTAERITPLIEIHILTALAYQVSGDIPAALNSLRLALQLAEPNGFVRLFLDEGIPIQRLLSKMRDEDEKNTYRDQLLASFHPSPFSLQPLIEVLSPREMDVLRLLVRGLSDKEISEQLIIAPTTVIWHNQNIFRKLGVSNRTQAAARAREMRLVE
ncbi:MAG TPA: LuxR C-terminal-related transcriptional regulator, partial [Anaerolineales bacterium]|nr:LuxR C-terminal-related transcriptional regulator [Anaerolineales bacterium]